MQGSFYIVRVHLYRSNSEYFKYPNRDTISFLILISLVYELVKRWPTLLFSKKRNGHKVYTSDGVVEFYKPDI